MSIKNNFPNTNPSLVLDFARTKRLDPRVTFTRGSTGTYYDGRTVAKAEENLLIYSQEFDNAAWVKNNVSISPNTATAPDGTGTADVMTASAASATIAQAINTTINPHTFSIWLRRSVGSGAVQINGGSGWVSVSVSASWQRFDVTQTPPNTSPAVGILLAVSGDAVEVWGAQHEKRSSVTAYTPTTAQPITNYIPVLQTAAANTARFDHDPVTGESKGLLIEEQRTNLLTYSEQFDNAAWTKIASAVASNSVMAPDGSLSADKIVADVSNAQHYATNAVATSVTIGGTYTMTVYAKAGGYSWLGLQACSSSGQAWFNLSNGTVGTVQSGVTAAISSAGNGWYRCSITVASAAGNAHYIFVRPADSQYVMAGDGFSGVYIWGAQLEVGAFPTSYIPTVASQVTRSADSASMTGTNFSSWYRQDKVTLYTEATINGSINAGVVSINDGISSNRIGFQSSGGPQASMVYRFVSTSGSTASTDISYQAGIPVKMVLSAQSADQAAFINGTQFSGITQFSSMPTVNTMYIGNAPAVNMLNGTIKKIAYYPKRLSNAELQNLTI